MNGKKISIACDHAAFELKNDIIKYFSDNGIEYEDFGCYSSESVNYPQYAHAVCKEIQEGRSDLGILICGTGLGMSLAANKHKGIRAVACSDTFSARLSRMHNNANILCFGARVVGKGLAVDLVKEFLNAEFLGGRHEERVNEFMKYEDQ